MMIMIMTSLMRILTVLVVSGGFASCSAYFYSQEVSERKQWLEIDTRLLLVESCSCGIDVLAHMLLVSLLFETTGPES